MAKTNALTEWLGIPPGEQPPSHYRLLGLKPLESDRGRIDAAAEDLIFRVRRQAGEQHKAVGENLVGMIEAARSCLLNVDRKSAYDAKLRRAKVTVAAPVAAPVDAPIELEQIVQSDEPRSIAQSRMKKKSPSMLLPIVGGAVVPLLIYVFLMSGWLGGEKKDERNPAGERRAENRGDSKSSESAPNTKAKSAKIEQVENKPSVKKPLPPVKIARKSSPTPKKRWVAKTKPRRTVPTVFENADTVDLLKLIDPQKHTVRGAWKIEGGHLVSASDGHIRIPFIPAEEYELHITASLSPGQHANPFFGIGLVGGGRRFTVLLNETNFGIPHRNGLTVLDNKPFASNETYFAKKIVQVAASTRIVCRVVKGGVTVFVARRPVIEWRGDFSRFSESPEWPVPNPKELMIAVGKSPYRITNLKIRQPASAQPPQTHQFVDLLKLIDPNKHRVAGKWALDGKTLVNQGGGPGIDRLQIPYAPPEEYQLNITVEKTTPRGWGLMVGLVSGKTRVTPIVDFGGRYTGLYMIDRKVGLDRYESADVGRLLKEGVPAKITYNVRKSGVSIIVDGRTIVDWKGDLSRLSMHRPDFDVPNETQLFIGGLPCRITKIALRPLGTPSPKPPTQQVVDLLKKIDVKRDSVRGGWHMVRGFLISPGVKDEKLYVDQKFPEEYDLNMTVSRRYGNDGLLVSLIGGGKPFCVCIDDNTQGPGEYSTSLYGVANRLPHELPEAHHGQILEDKQPVKLVISVRKKRIEIKADGRSVFKRQGDFSDLKIDDLWSIPRGRGLCLGSPKTVFWFTKLELRPLGAESEAVLRTPPVYLDSLRPVSTNSTFPPNHNAKHRKIRLKHSQFFHRRGEGPGQTTFRLGKKFRWLRGMVGIPDSSAQKHPIAVRFYGDGKLLWQSKPLKKNTDTDQFVIDVSAVDRMEVWHQSLNKDIHISHLLFLDPHFLTQQAKPPTMTLAEVTKPLLVVRSARIDSKRPTIPDVAARKKSDKKRSAIPDLAERKKADKLIRELFEEEFANLKRASDKLKLARKLLEQGQTTGDDPAARYVLLEKAKELSMDAGDVRLALHAVDSIVEHFDLAPFKERLVALRKLAASARGIAKGKPVATAAFENARFAFKAGNLEMSLDFVKLARSTATKFRQRRLEKEITELRTTITAFRKWHADAAEADKTLADKPDDPAANLMKGRFLCYIKQDWASGLPLLAKGADAGLKSAAILDSANPTDGKGMAAVGDAWRKLAEAQKKDSFEKSQWLSRAAHWYRKAVPKLMGLQKTLIEKRLRDIGEIPSNPFDSVKRVVPQKKVTGSKR